MCVPCEDIKIKKNCLIEEFLFLFVLEGEMVMAIKCLREKCHSQTKTNHERPLRNMEIIWFSFKLQFFILKINIKR